MFCGNFITGSLANCRPYRTLTRASFQEVFGESGPTSSWSAMSALNTDQVAASYLFLIILPLRGEKRRTFGRLSSCAGVLKISKLLSKFCLSISIGCHGPGSTVYPMPCFCSFSPLLSVIRWRQARALGPALLAPELCFLSSRLFLSFLIFCFPIPVSPSFLLL